MLADERWSICVTKVMRSITSACCDRCRRRACRRSTGATARSLRRVRNGQFDKGRNPMYDGRQVCRKPREHARRRWRKKQYRARKRPLTRSPLNRVDGPSRARSGDAQPVLVCEQGSERGSVCGGPHMHCPGRSGQLKEDLLRGRYRQTFHPQSASCAQDMSVACWLLAFGAPSPDTCCFRS